MCHNSVLENEQIEKCIENGMPTKLIKTIKYTMRKRAANEELNQRLSTIQTKQEELNLLPNNNIKSENIKTTPVSRCPFGHGKFSTPTTVTFFKSPSSSTSTQINEMDISNNNFHERFPASSISNGNTITNLSGHFNENDANAADNLLAMGKIYNDDILAKSTQLTRQVAFVMQQAIKRLQSSKIYT